MNNSCSQQRRPWSGIVVVPRMPVMLDCSTRMKISRPVSLVKIDRFKRTFVKPRCEKTLRLNSFPVRCINKWNTLSEAIVCSDTVFKFKTRLDKVLLSERYILAEIS